MDLKIKKIVKRIPKKSKDEAFICMTRFFERLLIRGHTVPPYTRFDLVHRDDVGTLVTIHLLWLG